MDGDRYRVSERRCGSRACRYDCSAFRLQSILRILQLHAYDLDPATRGTMEETLLGFSYWMDQGDPDSPCCWSENHRVLVAADELLAGWLMPERVFIADREVAFKAALILDLLLYDPASRSVRVLSRAAAGVL